MKNYSQFSEQEHILRAIELGGDVGRFLDVGSWDAVTFSNTRALVELGWSGVLIEPAPGPFMELIRCCTKCGVGVDEREHEVYGQRKQLECSKCGGTRYGNDPRFTLIQAAVALEPGLLEINVTDDALSTNDASSFEKWKGVGGFYGKITVPTITLEQISNQFGGFDVVSIDTEGTAVDLFLHALKLGWGPKVFCVEHDNRLAEMSATATKFYNLTYANGTNAVWIRK